MGDRYTILGKVVQCIGWNECTQVLLVEQEEVQKSHSFIHSLQCYAFQVGQETSSQHLHNIHLSTHTHIIHTPSHL